MTDEDPRFEGNMNYLDWLMNVLKPNELTPKNIDEIISFMRKARASAESGVKPKKADSSPKIDLVALGLVKAEKPIKRRRVGDG